jgi:hypothetical protein
MEKTLNSMATQFQTQVKAQVELRTRELKAAKNEAIEAGDVGRVDQIDAEIDQQRAVVVEPEPVVSDEVSTWIDKNPWYTENMEMQDWASTHNTKYVARTGDVAGSLDKTAEAVKKAFPDYKDWKKAETRRTPPPNTVEGGAEPKDTGGKKNFSVGRLSKDQKRVYDQMVKVHNIMSHEEYFQGLEEVGELS